MPNVFDTAAYIKRNYPRNSKKHGTLTAMKLQKLVYYSQAWSLVWDDEPLFQDPINAWVYGPASPRLFRISQGEYIPQKIPGHLRSGNRLSKVQKETINIVMQSYGKYEPEELTELVSSEPPWRKARNRHNLGLTIRGNATIRRDDMKEYYSSIADE